MRADACVFCVRRQLPPVDAFALDAGVRARATARGVRGAAPPQPGATFAALPGRSRGGAAFDRERLDNILTRDPHAKELLETMDDLLK
jgi:hypothetical protein